MDAPARTALPAATSGPAYLCIGYGGNSTVRVTADENLATVAVGVLRRHATTRSDRAGVAVSSTRPFFVSTPVARTMPVWLIARS